jgi:hypothetical protein
MRGSTAGTYHDWSAFVVVAFRGLGVYLPHEEIRMESCSSMGATHAPSSCGKTHKWSRPPDEFQNGCTERIHSRAER